MVSILLDPGPNAEPIRERVESPGESVHVPHLLDVEVLNVLRRQMLRGILTKERGATALQDLENTKMTRYPHAPAPRTHLGSAGERYRLRRGLHRARRSTWAPLVTRDARLAQAPNNRATVELYR